jgi:hypothetical protein
MVVSHGRTSYLSSSVVKPLAKGAEKIEGARNSILNQIILNVILNKRGRVWGNGCS